MVKAPGSSLKGEAAGGELRRTVRVQREAKGA